MSAGRSWLARCGKPSDSWRGWSGPEGGVWLSGRLRRRHGRSHCVRDCGLPRMGRQRRDRKSDRGPDHTKDTVSLGPGRGCGSGVASQYGQSQRPSRTEVSWVLPPTKLHPREPSVIQGTSDSLAWIVPSMCPECERRTGRTGSLSHIFPDVAADLECRCIRTKGC